MSTSLFMVAKFDQRQASPIKMSGVLVAASMGKSPLIALQRSIKWEIVFFSEFTQRYYISCIHSFVNCFCNTGRGETDFPADKVLKLSQNDILWFRVSQNYHNQNPIYRTLAR